MKRFALLIIAPLAACGGAVSPRAASFTSELVSCVVEAGTREQSHSCRDAVEAKYADGGAK